MDKLQIDNWTRQIEVNDNGDTIQYSLADSTFYDELISFAKWIQSDELRAQAEEVTRQQENIKKSGGKFDLDAASTANTVEMNMSITACEKIDKMFGENACKKVFGDITPQMDIIVASLNAVIPIVKKNTNERNKKINTQFSKSRKGAKS